MKPKTKTFYQQIKTAYQAGLEERQNVIPEDERIRIDLHCHDENSTETDELWGRILRYPETWLKTDNLVKRLQHNGCNAITVTNHNNARSCWDLLERGIDVLVGAEFTCTFQEEGVKLHVLAYGFSPEQEHQLNRLRNDLLQFLAYTTENDIPTVLPHPLYYYSARPLQNLEFFEKVLLLFERFEVMNGQRDLWQDLLTWEWVTGFDREKLETLSKKYHINPSNFCRNPLQKRLTGGSDDHMGIFAGTCGSFLHAPNLAERLKSEPASAIALEALRNNHIAPFGVVSKYDKLTVAILDYICQISMYVQEPGLLRMFLHRGTARDKLMCLAISNAVHELKRHKFTLSYLQIFHQCLHGKRPGFLTRLRVNKDFKPVFAQVDKIARSKTLPYEEYHDVLQESIPEIFSTFNKVIAQRFKKKEIFKNLFSKTQDISTQSLIKKFEIPSHLRVLYSGEKDDKVDRVSRLNLSEVLDGLSFPVLGSIVIVGSSYISTRSITSNRPVLNQFATALGKHHHPRKALWLTDTLTDRNGVSASLTAKLKKITAENLPIDFLICSNSIPEQQHLKVVKPIGSFTFPNYKEQTFNVPNILEIKQVFLEGGYDRLVCSTEFVMGLVTILLKQMFTVPAYFFLHTDWIDFIEKTMKLDTQDMDRIRRILRAFYHSYDRIFVLNRDHRDWLAGNAIKFPESRIHLTAHWIPEMFYPRQKRKSIYFRGKLRESDLVMLYAGRISEEKGVMELPAILKAAKGANPTVKLAIAGVGPAEEELKKQLPEALFLGWLDREEMPELYSNADLLILPSRFDTFGNVILEAMSCGLPTAAYNIKGPRDIILDKAFGILAENLDDLIAQIKAFVMNPVQRKALRKHSLNRAEDFSADQIMERFIGNLGLGEEPETEIEWPEEIFKEPFWKEMLDIKDWKEAV